ncbi:MAG: biopolymer transporter ExbD [Candidatus Zixiibacteriota bacterium]
MLRRPHVRQYKTVADINIANLVDVVLVLLIIFMISAPLLQSGIEVDLPKTRAAILQDEVTGVVVTIDNKGGTYINDVWAAPAEFETKLKREMEIKGTTSVYLRGDSAVAYGSAINIIGKIKEAGIENIGLVTAYEEKPPARRGRR